MRDWTMPIFALCTVLAAVAPTAAMADPMNCFYRHLPPCLNQSGMGICFDSVSSSFGNQGPTPIITINIHWFTYPWADPVQRKMVCWWDKFNVVGIDAVSNFETPQVEVGKGDQGSWQTSFPINGDSYEYAFRVQGCTNQPLQPAICGPMVEVDYNQRPPTATASLVTAPPVTVGLVTEPTVTGSIVGAPPPPQPPQNLHTSISISGYYIQVLWNNPPGVLHATVTRTPAWPGASALNVPPATGSANLKDAWIVGGQRYSYNVCLSYQTGNLCGSVTGELPGPPSINRQITPRPIIGAATGPGQQANGNAPINRPFAPQPFNGAPTAPSQQTLSVARPGLVAHGVSRTCKPGFVWREAYDGDQVCVTPQARDQAAADNRAASARQTASGQCVSGYVWRAANPEDHVCVTPQTRAQTAQDNASAHDAAVR